MNKVKGYRVMCNLTQDDMASIVGISRKSYNDKETGKRNFTIIELQKIRDAINLKGANITLDDLVS